MSGRAAPASPRSRAPIHRELPGIVERHREAILRDDPGYWRHSGGYRLDGLARGRRALRPREVRRRVGGHARRRHRGRSRPRGATACPGDRRRALPLDRRGDRRRRRCDRPRRGGRRADGPPDPRPRRGSATSTRRSRASSKGNPTPSSSSPSSGRPRLRRRRASIAWRPNGPPTVTATTPFARSAPPTARRC